MVVKNKKGPGLRQQLDGSNILPHSGELTREQLNEWFEDILYGEKRKPLYKAIGDIKEIEDDERANLRRLVKANQFELVEELLKIFKVEEVKDEDDTEVPEPKKLRRRRKRKTKRNTLRTPEAPKGDS
jgi:hypothetical protein